MQQIDRSTKLGDDGVLAAVGNTPLVKLSRCLPDIRFNVYAKLESLNPGGSTKDRPALSIIRHALETGAIRRDTVVVESSSGNMGIGLAQACAFFQLPFICVVDPKTSRANIDLMKAYGAEVEMVTETDTETGEYLPVRIRRVETLLQSVENSFWVNQYSNEYNPLGHWQTMHEITTALEGRVDYLFCATSTCGTLKGCRDYIRSHKMATKIYGVDAVGSVIFGGEKGKRLLPGHGAAVRPPLLQPGMADECVHVTDLECVVGCRRLARQEAILVGGSSGAVLIAAERVRRDIREGANCVLIFPDRGERYVSTIFSDSWVEEHFGIVSYLWEAEGEARTCRPLTVTS